MAAATSDESHAPVASYTVDSHELRCLSVVRPLVFMLAIEQDIALCASKNPSKPFEIIFPWVAAAYRRLVSLCASRFQLHCDELENKDDATKKPCVVVHGIATLPLLRYVDFLPGGLHPEEIFSTTPDVGLVRLKEPKLAGSQKPIAPSSVDDSSSSASSQPASPVGATKVYAASSIDFTQYQSEDAEKFDGSAFYLTIEQGLPIATHGHLLRFEVPKNVPTKAALYSFQKFSGWDQLDMRWDSESTQRAGVLVFPSAADVAEILEKYEDEETDDDLDAAGWSQHTPTSSQPFRIRPVAPCTHVPYLEDAQLRRLRGQLWEKVLKGWQQNKRSSNTIVIQFPSSSCSLDEVMKPLQKDKITEAALVVDKTPLKRRRVYVTFSDPEATRAALELDGVRLSIAGKPTFRIQVAPPFFDTTRRGSVLSLFPKPDRSVSPQAASTTPPMGAADKKNRRGSRKGKDGEATPPPEGSGTNNANKKRDANNRTPPPKPKSATKTNSPPPPSPSSVCHNDGGEVVPSQRRQVSPQAARTLETTSAPKTEHAPAATTTPSAAPAPTATKLSTSAAPFVPGQRKSPAMGSSTAPPPPPSYNATVSPLMQSSAPPPYSSGGAPPSGQQRQGGAGGPPAYGASPPMPFMPTSSPITSPALPPPAYQSNPPPAYGNLPPAYGNTPTHRPASGVPPPPPPYGMGMDTPTNSQ